MTLVKTTDGASYLHAQEEYWRAYDFVESSICLQQPETDEDFYQSAVGFGTFQQLLSDFPAEKLHDTIPNFHNTPDRYRAFLETLERDPMHRAAQVQPEIEFALARQAEMAALQTALKSGELPLRVTHNDTKLNNVLLDAKTRRALCVIDLDTVMPGYIAEGKPQLSIAIGCTGGQHRSVAIAEATARYLEGAQYHVSISHRDLSRANTKA